MKAPCSSEYTPSGGTGESSFVAAPFTKCWGGVDRYLVLFGDGVLSWYKSKQHCVEHVDQPMESVDLMEVCSITNDSRRTIQFHTFNGNTINLRVP